MWSPVAAAPYLGRFAPRRPEDRYPGILETGRALTGRGSRACYQTGRRPAHCPRRGRCPATSQAGRRARHQARAALASDYARVRQGVPRALRRNPPAGAAVSVRRRGPPCCPPSRTAAVPRVDADRYARGVSLDRGEKTELGHEAVIVRGQLAVDSRREGVVGKLAFEQPRPIGRHRPLSVNHGNAQLAASCPAGLGDDVIVGGRPRLSKAARYCWCQWT